MSAGDKASPKGALEEAVALFDELRDMVRRHSVLTGPDASATLADLQRRRAALEPRLGRRRENQAKPRADKESKP